MLNIALNTFREISRNKYLYMILFFAFFFIIFSVSLSRLTIGDTSKIIIDFGLSMIEFFGFLGVLFVGSQLLFKEIEGKTILLILSKPIKRYEFILGKFLGFSFAVFLIILLQSIIFLVLLFYQKINVDFLIVWSLVNTFFKLEITLCLVFFLSTFMSNLLIIATTTMIYFLSHSFSTILDIANKTGNEIFIYSIKILGIIFPPMQALNTKDLIGNFSNINSNYIFLNLGYSIIYIFLVLFFTIIIFKRKNFEN